MRFPLSLLLLAAPAGGLLEAQTAAADSLAVVQVLERFHAALRAGDSTGALRLLAPDAVIVETGGIETLAEYRSHHLPGDISYAKANERKPGPVSVRVVGSVAWAWSTSETTGTSQGQPFTSLGAELAVLKNSADGWRIQSIHWSSRRRR